MTILILTILVFLIVVFFFIGGFVLYKFTFKRLKNDEKFAELENPKDKKEASRVWFSKQKVDVFTIKSKDNLTLKGYFLNNNSNKIALILHGYHGRYYSSTTQAKIFYEEGYDVLLPNNRAHDTSEGDYFTMGPKEVDDVLRWIDLLIKRNSKYEIVLMGVSMGAHIAMSVIGDKNLPNNVKVLIEDCGYNNLKSILYDQLRTKFTPGFSKTLLLFSSFYSYISGFSLNHSVNNSLQNMSCPILLIHGDKDNYVKTYNVYLNEEKVNANVDKELAIFNNARHNESKLQTQKYKETILSFIRKYIK